MIVCALLVCDYQCRECNMLPYDIKLALVPRGVNYPVGPLS